MKKNNFGLLLIAMMFILVLTACQSEKVSHVIDSAKIINYDTAEELISKSVLIVDVTKIDEESFSTPLGNGHSDNFTLSHVKLIKMIKPMTGKDFQLGDSIKILESEWSDSANKQIVHHTEGYVKMKANKNYTLYLGYNESTDTFYPLGLLYGKIPHDPAEEKIWGGELPEEIEMVQKNLASKTK